MKKYITIALCFLLLIMLAVPTFAAEETKVTVTPSKTTVQRGETIEFTISISGDTAFSSVFAELTFDPEVFEFVSGEAKNTAGMLVDYDGTSIGLMNAPAAVYNGELQVLTFRVKDTAPIDPTTITGSASGNSGNLAVQFVEATVNINCEHEWSWTKIDGDKHTKSCPKCQTSIDEEHTWNEGEVIDPPTCTEPGKEKYTCIFNCGAEKTEDLDPLGHDWANDCDKVCGRDSTHTRETEHDYPDEWEKDTTSHWHECTKCGDRKDNAEHTPGPEATDTTAQICTVCEYVIKPAKEHVHAYDDEWVYDTDYHWHRCITKASPDCYVTDGKAPHDYDNDCDVDCNTCGAIRTPIHDFSTSKLTGNVDGHYYKCAGKGCNATSKIEDHIPGEEATEDTPQRCTECGFIIKMQLSHVHEFGETWLTDDAKHWKSCSDANCHEMESDGPHEWDEGVEVPEGYLYTCAVCGYQLTQAQQMGVEPTTPPTTPGETTPSGNEPTQPAAPENPGEAEEKGGIPWKWAGIAAIILLIIGFILIIIEFFRSRKTNMHGKFSK